MAQSPDCSDGWCESPGLDGARGVDCWAGSPTEPCTCQQGSARLVGPSGMYEGYTYYEYTCCTQAPTVGEACGDFGKKIGPSWPADTTTLLAVVVLVAIILCCCTLSGGFVAHRWLRRFRGGASWSFLSSDDDSAISSSELEMAPTVASASAVGTTSTASVTALSTGFYSPLLSDESSPRRLS